MRFCPRARLNGFGVGELELHVGLLVRFQYFVELIGGNGGEFQTKTME
jgi:hypothetical protein